jgi:RNA polymerase sigma-70 factor (ECF subfamily)
MDGTGGEERDLQGSAGPELERGVGVREVQLPPAKEFCLSLLIPPAGRQSSCVMMGDSYHTPDDHTLHVQQLFVRHQQAVLGYVLSIEPRFADAQDIVQEVFLVVSRKAQTWSAGTDFLAWACTVARYETLHFQRTRARRTARLDEDVIELLYAAEAVDESEWQHRVDALRRCLGRLAPRAKELVWRRYHGAQMPEQIATEVGWTVNAVRVALTRARGALRECMEEQLNASGEPR